MSTEMYQVSIYRAPFMRAVIASIFAAGFAVTANAETVVEFAKMDSMPSNWSIGSQSGGKVSISTDVSQTLNRSAGSLMASYPVSPGAVYAWGVYDVSRLKTQDLYIDFWAKMPGAKQGLKFLKIFGAASGSNNYANTTFALDYTGGDNGAMYQVSFGDGSATANDTGNVINFDGSNPAWIGRSSGKATVSTPQKRAFGSSSWGTSWHHFKMRVKFNSGTSSSNEVADGAYYVEIDNKVYVDAKGLFNRHPSNGPIERIELFGWAQSGTAPFEVWYDDVRITTGGFSGSTSQTPSPPTAVSAN